MRTYLSPIGYDSTRVTRPVLSNGLDTDDEIILIRPSDERDDARADEAVQDVERMVTEIEPDVVVSRIELPHADFEGTVIESATMITAAEGETIVNLSGGARDLLVPFTVATLSQHHQVDLVLHYSDIDGEVRELAIPALATGNSTPADETLAGIASLDGTTSIPVLTETLDRAKSTITRHVQQLETAELVETWHNGKTKHVEITLAGKLRLIGPS